MQKEQLLLICSNIKNVESDPQDLRNRMVLVSCFKNIGSDVGDFSYKTGLQSVLPEHFSWKSRISDEKRTKKTGEKAQKNGEKTSFQLDFSLILTLPTFFIAFLYINFFKSWSFSYFLKKKLMTP